MSAVTMLRYWPDAFIPIINGTAPTNFEEFHTHADMLLKFRNRAESNLLTADFADPIALENTIKEFFSSYCTMSKVIDISERVNTLSQTRFITEISTYNADIFDADENTFIEACAVPGALKATPGGLTLLENPEARKLLTSFTFAITVPKDIHYNMKSYRGLSLEQMKYLSTQRGFASEWFQHYPIKIDKEAIRLMKEALATNANGISDAAILPNKLMQTYYQRYIDLSLKFRQLDQKGLALDKDGVPYSRENAYWESLQTNLQHFIDNAK